jgi:hypothetical protein
MSKLRPYIPHMLLVLLGALLALWYFNQEWEEQAIDMGPTKEARRNPLLALQRLLEQQQKPVETIRGFAGLERLQFGEQAVGDRDALVLLNTGGALRESQVASLRGWVEQGGQLIVTVENPYFSIDDSHKDPLLNLLGLALNHTPWLEHEAVEENKAEASEEEDDKPADIESFPLISDNKDEDPAAKSCGWRPTYLPIHLRGQEQLQLAFGYGLDTSFVDVTASSRPLVMRDEQIYLAQMRVGAGEIFALVNASPLGNNYIACGDNAFVMWQLLRDSDKVWLVLNSDTPSFWRLLWETSMFGCLALLAALALWLWYKVPRFGPVLTVPVTGRRQFLDHIRASAHFLLRHQNNAALVEPLREEILQKLRLRQPGFAQLAPDQQVEKIAQLSGIQAADLHLALYHPLPVQDAVFIDIVQRLQHLRNSL